MNVEAILTKLESIGYVRLKKRVGNYMTCYCPFHNDGNERKPSCGVLLIDEYKGAKTYPAGLWHCFSCGYAKSMIDAVGDILKLHNINMTGLEWLQQNIAEFSVDTEFEFLIPQETMASVENKYALDYINTLTKKETVNYVSEEELASYRYTVPYMYERKLTDEIIAKFDVGFDAHFKLTKTSKHEIPCITFPVRDAQGRTLFFCRRSIERKFYHYPEGVLKPLYAIDQIPKGCRTIIVCESIINCLTLWGYGYVAVALMGTGNDFQIDQLKALGAQNIILCMDGDAAGKRATKRLKRCLKSCAMIWVIDLPEGEDVNSVDRKVFEECYNNRY